MTLGTLFLVLISVSLSAIAQVSVKFGMAGARAVFRDDDTKFSLVTMVEGTADRPYVYRQLLPALANATEAALPVKLREALTRSLYTQEGTLKSGLRSRDALKLKQRDWP